MKDSRISLRRVATGFAGISLPLLALAMHLFVVASYLRQWDKTAAITVLPFWIWGLSGLFLAFAGWLIARRPFALFVSVLWLVTLVFGSDETRGLTRILKAPVQEERTGTTDSGPFLRVITFNCDRSNVDSAREILRFSPDIVLLQEAPSPRDVEKLAMELFGEEGSAVGGWHCAIIARGKLEKKVSRYQPRFVLATLKLPGSNRTIDVSCLHLGSAPTRLDLWNREAWRLHRDRRITRRNNMNIILKDQEKHLGGNPLLLGGDFNAPPSDPVFNLLAPNLTDAWTAAGRGWGNTFSNRLPILRIDRLFASPEFQPVRAQVFRTKLSDHRLIVCDYSRHEFENSPKNP